MKPGPSTLFPLFALVLIAGSGDFAGATSPRPLPFPTQNAHPAAHPQPPATGGCLLAFSAIGVPTASGIARDVMLAWSLITGSVRRPPTTPQPSTTADCPISEAAIQARRGSASSPVASSPTTDAAAAADLEIGVRYHFGPNTQH